MMDGGRQFPALEVTWPDRPTDIDRELLLAALDEHAATAVEDMPLGARVFFSSADARDRAAADITAALFVRCTPIEVSDERWAERSQASLPPITVGGITITTSEVAPEVALGSDSRGHVVIRPSMGFGTGHHASTRLCLSLLQRVALDGQSVLDIGTGSGVLAIAAFKLGATSVTAIDNDADAIHSARENLELNQVADAIVLLECDLANPTQDARHDLVTANLTGTHLVTAAPLIDAYASVPHGHLILGGLQVDEEPDVRRAFARLGWALEARADEDGWAGLLLYRG